MTPTLAGAVTEARFKELMSTFPSGVTVVTAVDQNGVPHGLTCSSLCSVSLHPPLLLVCVNNRSRTLAVIREQATFAVNMIHTGGREASETFSTGGVDRFRRVPWRRTPARALPWLSLHSHAVAECELRRDMRAGDHTILIGEVVDISMHESATPLLYGLRQYASWPT